MKPLSQVQKLYQEKLVTAKEAAMKIKDGDRIAYGFTHCCPYDIDAAIAERVVNGELKNLKFECALSIRDKGYDVFDRTSTVDEVQFTSPHMVGLDRSMLNKGRNWFTPMFFNELPSFWRNRGGWDVVAVQVTPMDEFGNFNLGPSPADIYALLQTAKMIIFEVNTNMPRALGIYNDWNIDDVDWVIEGSNTPLAELPPSVGNETDAKVAKYVVDLIEEGSTLQLGIGGLPTVIGNFLAESDKGDFSIHTEFMSHPYMDLIKAGKVTSSKNRDTGKIVYTLAGGSKELYDFIDNNQTCMAAPVDYVNNFSVISSIDKFVSVNGCINVDLYGQVCSETVGYRHISGTGGQLDFVMGAYASKGGKSFICLNSVRENKDGSLTSNIRPILPQGAVVSTPRPAVHYLVTEFGAVNLKGIPTWQRTEALISIAHPDFRDELIKEADMMGLWTRTSKSTY